MFLVVVTIKVNRYYSCFSPRLTYKPQGKFMFTSPLMHKYLFPSTTRRHGNFAGVGTVDGQIKLGQKCQSHKSKFTNLHRLITALSQIG
jgi:hypothetical protein